MSSWSSASHSFSSKISPSRHAFSPSPLPHKAQGTKIWPFYLRSHKTFTLQLHTPALTAGLCAHLQVRDAFNNLELCSQGCNSPMNGREESSTTHGWFSASLMDGSLCTNTRQCLVRKMRKMHSKSHKILQRNVVNTQCEYIKLYCLLTPLAGCLGQWRHAGIKEDKHWAQFGSCTSEAQGDGGNPARSLPRRCSDVSGSTELSAQQNRDM